MYATFHRYGILVRRNIRLTAVWRGGVNNYALVGESANYYSYQDTKHEWCVEGVVSGGIGE